MANLKEIRTRISSISSTRQITSAMKMVSAAKLRKAQDAILQLRPYAEKLQDILSAISDALQNEEDNVFEELCLERPLQQQWPHAGDGGHGSEDDRSESLAYLPGLPDVMACRPEPCG